MNKQHDGDEIKVSSNLKNENLVTSISFFLRKNYLCKFISKNIDG